MRLLNLRCENYPNYLSWINALDFTDHLGAGPSCAGLCCYVLSKFTPPKGLYFELIAATFTYSLIPALCLYCLNHFIELMWVSFNVSF